MSGQSEDNDVALEQAIAWRHALAFDAADWDAYLEWLEADPRHRVLFDEIALLDRIVDERAASLPLADPSLSQPEPVPHISHRRWWLGSALAAAIAAAVAIPSFMAAPADKVFTTAIGETRQFAIRNGETVELAPASRLIMKEGNPEKLELAQGEAFFSIAHDRTRVLNIQAAGFSIRDIGTKFGINLAAGSVTVGVAEGYVHVAPHGGSAQRLGAGQQIFGRAGTLSSIRQIAPDDVGSWRGGRLVYNSAPLRVVADDLARYSGKKVTVDPSIGEEPFSGVLIVGDGGKLFQNVADLMAIAYQSNGENVRFTAGPARQPD